MNFQYTFLIMISLTLLLYIGFIILGFLLRDKNIKAQKIDK